MLSKIKNVVISIVFVICFIGVGTVLFEKCSNKSTVNYKVQLDSLDHIIDSLHNKVKDDESVISSLMVVDSVLTDKLAHQKTKTIPVIKYVDSSKTAVGKFTDSQLVSLFNKRYNVDTFNNKLALAQPVLIEAAKDLVELDGARQILVIKDSIISTSDKIITNKDSIIKRQELNIKTHKDIVFQQYHQNQLVMEENSSLRLTNKKLNRTNKLTKIGAGIAIGLMFFIVK